MPCAPRHVRAAQGKGELSVRALARMVGRDVKRVHEDAGVLTELGLLERTEDGGVLWERARPGPTFVAGARSRWGGGYPPPSAAEGGAHGVRGGGG